ncbi:MAG TPA: insulinase family protein [Gemmatimonadales bacterium]|nr:insulinase family protein [Gemmatimonadales bacterium]
MAATLALAALCSIGGSLDQAAQCDVAGRGAACHRAAAVRPAADALEADSLQQPGLVMGTLPNGLRYYLLPNRAPAHRVELRLAVNAGSVLEDADQQGFAHFLEHMAFNGTRRFPHTSVVDFLETSGMRFGADVNAMTTPDETIYTLTLPSDDRRLVARGLDILEDWAGGGITIDSNEVVAERGVVMGEWRMRLPDTASQAVQAHYDSLWYGTSAYLTRQPIGDTALIAHAEPGPLRRFYRDWYRPDLMAVIVVGDFESAAMRREITRRFGAIPAPKAPRPRVSPPLTPSGHTVVDVYRGKVNPGFQLYWPAPRQPRNPRAAARQQLVQQLLTQELERRLLAIQRQPSRPFILAQVQRGRQARPIDLVGVNVIALPDSLERALGVVATELERVAQHGIPTTALAHAKAATLRRLEHAAASEAAVSSKAYADAFVDHFLTGEGLLLDARQELMLARALLPAITPEVLAEAGRVWRADSGRRVLITLPAFAPVRPPTPTGVIALLDSIARTSLPADSAAAVAESRLLEHLPQPGTIVGERRDAAAGITEWTLSNGARVIVKPTANDPDELLVRAWSPGGFSVMPDSLFFTPGRMVAKLMTEAAGLGTHDRTALNDQLATTGVRDLRVDIGYADESIQLAGSPKALETLFQTLYLQFTAPRLDTAAVHSWASLAKYQGTAFSLDDQFNQIFARGEPRLLPVGTELAELVNVEEALAVYRDRFGNAGDFTFTLVGAVTPAEVRPFVERYLASLPATAVRERPKPVDVKPFLTKVDNVSRMLELPQAHALWVFDGAFPSEPAAYLRARQTLGALTTVLQDRLRVRLREELGGTYSPMVNAFTYALPEEHYRALLAFVAAPERVSELDRELRHILDSVRAKGATAAELARAATIQRRQHETALEDNQYWLSTIGTFHRLGIPLAKIPDPYGSRPLTPAELRDAAQRYLPTDVYVHLKALPRDSTLAEKGDSVSGSAASHLSAGHLAPRNQWLPH